MIMGGGKQWGFFTELLDSFGCQLVNFCRETIQMPYMMLDEDIHPPETGHENQKRQHLSMVAHTNPCQWQQQNLHQLKDHSKL